MNWHGFSTPTANLYIGKLPGRKRIALYTITDGVLDTLATFTSEEAAKMALVILDEWIQCPYSTEVIR